MTDRPADDRCPMIEWLDLNAAIDSLDDWGVEVVSDGITSVGTFRRVTAREDVLDVSAGWSHPDIYLIAIHDTLTDKRLLVTDFRNLDTVKVL